MTVHPPTCCRFCQKNVKCQETKIPGVSIFNVVVNKVSGAESFLKLSANTIKIVLADLASSLGHELKRDPSFSNVSSLTCARILARTHASIVKLFSGIVERESLKVAKRQTNARSLTGDILLPRGVLAVTQEIYRNRPANPWWTDKW